MTSVGPVLTRGSAGDAVLAAIRELNRDVEVIDRGAYQRVLVPTRCVVTRAAIERHLASMFELPADLEMVMPSFKGRFSVSDHEARWEES
jgi:toluene monooxygenase system protein D